MDHILEFWDFFKGKSKNKSKEVSIDDLLECLFEITDDNRMRNDITEKMEVNDTFPTNNIFTVMKNATQRPFGPFIGVYQAKDKGVSANNNRVHSVHFRMKYSEDDISDLDIGDIIESCSEKLDYYNCKLYFFIGVGIRDECFSPKDGHTDGSGKKWDSYNKVIDYLNKFSPMYNRKLLFRIDSKDEIKKA